MTGALSLDSAASSNSVASVNLPTSNPKDELFEKSDIPFVPSGSLPNTSPPSTSVIEQTKPEVLAFKETNKTPEEFKVTIHNSASEETAKSFVDVKVKNGYKAGEWKEWNRDFAENILGLHDLTDEEIMDVVKHFQTLLYGSIKVDGKLGPVTLIALSKLMDIKIPDDDCFRLAYDQSNDSTLESLTAEDVQAYASRNYSKALASYLIEEEGFDARPDNPGVASGATIGHGLDLKFASLGDLALIKKLGLLPPAKADWLISYKKGEKSLEGFVLTRSEARAVLDKITIPKFTRLAENWIGKENFDVLPQEKKIALIGLVFNRGTRISGSTRKEMAATRGILGNLSSLDSSGKAAAYKEVSSQIKQMNVTMASRWAKARGLFARRNREASMFNLNTYT